MRYHIIPTRVVIIKKMDNKKCWQGCREMKPLFINDGNVKWFSCFRKQSGSSSNSTLMYISKKSKQNPYKNLYTDVHGNNHSSQKVDQAKCQSMMNEITKCDIFTYTTHTYNGMLFSHKKKWSIDKCYNAESWKHYAMLTERCQIPKTTHNV